MANKTGSQSKISAPLVLTIAIAIAALGLWGYLASRPRVEPTPDAITAEGKAYVRSLQLGNVEMKATENFAGSAVVEITGTITNGGERVLDRAELTCVFYDPYGKELKRERVPIVRSTLKPGETRTFRLPFEAIPPDWNQALPSLVIASIRFAA